MSVVLLQKFPSLNVLTVIVIKLAIMTELLDTLQRSRIGHLEDKLSKRLEFTRIQKTYAKIY